MTAGANVPTWTLAAQPYTLSAMPNVNTQTRQVARHCERSEAIQYDAKKAGLPRRLRLLAMTRNEASPS
jgi:hypothetical protein